LVKRHWGLSTTAIFGDLGGYVFENFGEQPSGVDFAITELLCESTSNALTPSSASDIGR